MIEYCIVGLGNPGTKYEHTRHNIGFTVVDRLRLSLEGPTWQMWRKLSYISHVRRTGVEALLVKPQTYMNCSGQAVGALCRYRGIPNDRLLVIHDELDLRLGDVRLKFGGGEAGHRGLKDCARALSTRDYWRLRVGIGRPSVQSTQSHVLGRFLPDEDGTIESAITFARESLTRLIEESQGITTEAAQTFQKARQDYLKSIGQ